MIYLVCLCNYEHELVIGYFKTEQQAKDYCTARNHKNEYYNDMKYCVRKVEELQ